MEPACSNIAMQRIVNDHTSYMIRVRTKFKMDGELSEQWSASKHETLKLLHNTRTWGITRDRQGCHHLPPTPQPWDTIILEGSRAPYHHAHVQGNYPYPPRLQPYGLISKNMGKPEGTMNHHPNPSSISTRTSHI